MIFVGGSCVASDTCEYRSCGPRPELSRECFHCWGAIQVRLWAEEACILLSPATVRSMTVWAHASIDKPRTKQTQQAYTLTFQTKWYMARFWYILRTQLHRLQRRAAQRSRWIYATAYLNEYVTTAKPLKLTAPTVQ